MEKSVIDFFRKEADSGKYYKANGRIDIKKYLNDRDLYLKYHQ